MTLASELRYEQEVVDGLYARLDELRTNTRSRLTAVRREGPSGSPQNRSERDAFATLYEDRIAQLEAVEDRLAFGRLDRSDETLYVGRIGLTDEDHVPILTDWRAPAAQAFYRATAARPDGVRRRRHLVTRGREVTGLEDDLLELDPDAGADGLAGEGALLAAMAAGRTGRMGDIVATIQAEQDAIIRADMTGALVVQGGPGTGKTAVALHRAAYLLYGHRRMLERSGVLIVGPSHSFLRYIDQVLPSLGETGVVSATIADLVPGVVVDGEDDPAVARIKGRTAMARVIDRAIAARRRIPAADTPIRVEGHDLVIRRRDIQDAIGKARRTHKPHNLARVSFVREMLNRLSAQYAAQLGYTLDADDRAAITEELRGERAVRRSLNLAWFPLTPEGLIRDLYAKPHRLAEAARELNEEDRRLLARPTDSPWTPADVPLLDEAAELLGYDDQAARLQSQAQAAQRAADVDYARQVLANSSASAFVDAEALADRFAESGPRLTTAERAAQDRSWTYGHIVVDEAQELSPMAWRMLVRRCPSRSMTIVGDVAQTSAPAGARSWTRMLDPILQDSWRLAELTVNYRTPAAIAEAAGRVAVAAGLPVSELTSARDVAQALRFIEVLPGPDPMADLVAAAAQAAEGARDEFTGDGVGRVAVLATSDLLGPLRAALGTPVSDADDEPLVVLTPAHSKGLEFDAVILVEPAAILQGSPTTTTGSGSAGASDLYVAMTRPTQRLVVVHHRPLPPGLRS